MVRMCPQATKYNTTHSAYVGTEITWLVNTRGVSAWRFKSALVTLEAPLRRTSTERRIVLDISLAVSFSPGT